MNLLPLPAESQLRVPLFYVYVYQKTGLIPQLNGDQSVASYEGSEQSTASRHYPDDSCASSGLSLHTEALSASLDEQSQASFSSSFTLDRVDQWTVIAQVSFYSAKDEFALPVRYDVVIGAASDALEVSKPFMLDFAFRILHSSLSESNSVESFSGLLKFTSFRTCRIPSQTKHSCLFLQNSLPICSSWHRLHLNMISCGAQDSRMIAPTRLVHTSDLFVCVTV